MLTRRATANALVRTRSGRLATTLASNPTPKKTTLKKAPAKNAKKPAPRTKQKNVKDEKTIREIQSGRRELIVKVARLNDLEKASIEERVKKSPRRRRAPKFLEDSAELPEENEQKDRLPVYKQEVKCPERIKKDIYEFDVQETTQSDSDNDYDKDMDEDMKVIKRLSLLQKRRAKIPSRKRKAKNEIVVKQNIVLRHSNVDKKTEQMPIIRQENDNEQVELSSGCEAEAICEEFNNNDNDDPSPPVSGFMDVTYRTFAKPMANSTILHGLSTPRREGDDVPKCSSPWRPSLYRRNGPLILQTKSSSLPAYEQDLVMNATLDNHHKSPPEAAAPKRLRQTHMDSFVTGAQPVEAPLECTLFDEGLLLSPVKTSMPLRDCTNLIHSTSSSSWTRFLGDSLSPVKPKVGKPTRFLVRSPVKRDILKTNAPEVVVTSPELSSSKNESEDHNIVGIFEDYEGPTKRDVPNFTYARKRRNVRRRSIQTEDEADEEELEEMKSRKRRKRNEMTKEEKRNLNKWAKGFNAMCLEVSRHELEVE